MTMSVQKKPLLKHKEIRAQLSKELNFLKQVFSVLTLPTQQKDEDEENSDEEAGNSDDEIVNETSPENEKKEVPNRARSIAELEEKLEKIKSQGKFNLKRKLVKKSLTSKLNKKIKKRERQNKTKVKGEDVKSEIQINHEVKPKKEKVNMGAPKPVFNTDAKLVFSKFDFSSVGNNDKPSKMERDPKKILENLKQQEEKLKRLEENDAGNKVKEIKEKIAWKNILQKAEGQKVKDDPILLKKSIKKMEQKKKHSKKQWDDRVQSVKQKKEDRQKKRSENISKKKKEKKSKVIKAAVKRGRVVI